MKVFLVANELGLVLFDERLKAISKFQFPVEERARSFLNASSGTLSEAMLAWLKENLKAGDVIAADMAILPSLQGLNASVQPTLEEETREIRKDQISRLVEAGLAATREEAEEAIRDVSLEISNLRIKEMSSNPDLQAMEAVQALDEIDKTANIVASRLREWYGLHFPELTSLVDDNISLTKLILNFKSRSNFEADLLEQMGYSKAKSKAIETAAKQSRGADMRDEDLARVIQLAEEAQHLYSLRDKLASHVEKTMRQVAPNLSEIAGATIGARLIAKAGGLRRLAILPASTIQILGAEKALYRALRSGARPPKHGILFQHASVHSAPKWQRGKVARSVAGKIAIAARIDTFRGSKDETISKSLETRLDEIRQKYKEAPKRPEGAEFERRPGRFESFRGTREPGRERAQQRRRENRFPRRGRDGKRKPGKRDHERK